MIRQLGLALASALIAAGPAHAQDRLSPEAVAAMPLDEMVATMRGRCAMIVTAMAELGRRYPEKAKAEDCGGAQPQPDDAIYRPMDDDSLLAAIEDLSADLEALVARGEAIQAATAPGTSDQAAAVPPAADAPAEAQPDAAPELAPEPHAA